MQKERQKERERKCHSSEKMRWPLHCVCVCLRLNRKDQGDSLSDISCIFLHFALLPCQVNDIYVYLYRCAGFLCRGQMLMYVFCVCTFAFLFFFIQCKSCFLPFLCFSSQSSVSLTFSSFHCSLSSPLTHVGNVITFGGCGEGKEGDHGGGRRRG